jgi:long-chain acyl-CoA synthetase
MEERMNLAHLLQRSATSFPDQPAVALGKDILYDYRTLARRAASIGAGLTSQFGLAPGDRVAMFMPNCPEYLELLYAAWIAGLVVVPINAKLHPRELAYILTDSEAAVLFMSGAADAAVGAVYAAIPGLKHTVATGSAEYARLAAGDGIPIVEAGPDDTAWLFYTSGTTGQPKGVMLTHRNLLAMTFRYFTDVDQARREDAIVYAAPISHGAGMYNFPNMLVAALHVIPVSKGFDAAEFFELSDHFGSVTTFAAPTMVTRLVDYAEANGVTSRGIKRIVYGGGPMYGHDIKRAIAVLGECFAQIYGQGESPMTITALSPAHLGDRDHPCHEQRIVSVGVAQTGMELRIADESGAALPCGATGEILVRGDAVMKGYWRNPQATASTLRGGWLYTGDVGALDEDGFLTLKDRSKDIIISGGSNIYPREVEEVLLTHPAVDEVAVVGRSHSDWGEEIVALIVRRKGATVTDTELDQLCLAQIARFKRPKAYYFVPSLPKNNYGKVLKRELRVQLEQGMVELG